MFGLYAKRIIADSEINYGILRSIAAWKVWCFWRREIMKFLNFLLHFHRIVAFPARFSWLILVIQRFYVDGSDMEDDMGPLAEREGVTRAVVLSQLGDSVSGSILDWFSIFTIAISGHINPCHECPFRKRMAPFVLPEIERICSDLGLCCLTTYGRGTG